MVFQNNNVFCKKKLQIQIVTFYVQTTYEYFLNALTMVASESTVFQKLNCLSDGPFEELAEFGLYIFRFIKY